MSEDKSVARGCLPCATGHFSTSATFLNEAVRFKKDGLTSPQVLDDIAGAIGELNALERIDLTPAKIHMLPEWEKEMAELALEKSRELRHRLESIQSMEELENLAADTEEFYKKLNREWATKRLEECPTCKIKTQKEQEPEKPNLEQYGKAVAQRRKELLDEIRAGIGS